MQRLILLPFFVLPCTICRANAQEMEVGEYVIVETLDGRTRRGFVDPRTGPKALWIRSETPGILLRTTLAWELVTRIRPADADAEFRPPPFFIVPAPLGARPPLPNVGLPQAPATADDPVYRPIPLPVAPADERFRLDGPLLPLAPVAPPEWLLPGAILPYPSIGVAPQPPVPPRLSPEIAPGFPSSCETAGRVRTLQVQAQALNWDGDRDVDGLRLHVQPIARDGRVAVPSGSLSVELLARRFSRVRNNDEIRVVERWTRNLRSCESGPNGIVVDFPYRNQAWVCDPAVIPLGRVSVRMRVPSQGVFDATDDAVVLSPQSPL